MEKQVREGLKIDEVCLSEKGVNLLIALAEELVSEQQKNERLKLEKILSRLQKCVVAQVAEKIGNNKAGAAALNMTPYDIMRVLQDIKFEQKQNS